ncbi:uncharacterized protein [Linepithema humile]|uniref:uncharacterized protein n=1 Tax=Linepithema humile TaxID=83485 RepID=UPI00062306A4|nr:PREDICTED: cell wall integrity and stress response component 3-like [Linepithema humile]
MITLFCILIVLGLSHCDDLPLRIDLKSSNDRINNEVEKLSRQDSTLPQLNNLEEISIYNSDVKNEVIRRQNPEETAETTTNDNQDLANTTTTSQSTESTDVSTTTISTTTTTTTASDSARDSSGLVGASTPASTSSTSTGTNLVALEESFGGTTRAPDPVLPTRRRSGLYFLVDWNSFLEVGDDDQKINLRFQPKVGDRSRFLPVTVP